MFNIKKTSCSGPVWWFGNLDKDILFMIMNLLLVYIVDIHHDGYIYILFCIALVIYSYFIYLLFE